MDNLLFKSKDFEMSANQFLAFTILHALGHAAGIGGHGVDGHNLMNSGDYIKSQQGTSSYFSAATSPANNAVWKAFMINYFVTYPTLVRNYKGGGFTPYSFLPFYTIPIPTPSSYHPLNFMLNGYSQYIQGAH